MSTKPELGRQDAEPLYRQVASYLKDRISDGTYPPSSALPSENELTSLLGVSRPTVRHALKILVEEQLVESLPGRGSFVTERKPSALHRRTSNLALIGPELRDTFLTRIVTGAEHVTSQNDYHLILCNARNRIDAEERYLRDLWEEEKVDGFILLPADNPQPHELLCAFVREGIPVVLIDRFFEGLGAPYVVSDNLHGGYLLTKHLISLGHRRIGFLTRPNLYVSSVAHRLQGYRLALEEAGLNYDSGLVFQGLLPYLSEVQILERSSPSLSDFDRNAIKEFLTQSEPPTAVFACNDLIAVQVLEVCRELDLDVPEDLALVGYDDDSVASLLTPPLTTVRQKTHEMGACAAKLVFDTLNGTPVEQEVRLPVQLVVRQSCGAS